MRHRPAELQFPIARSVDAARRGYSFLPSEPEWQWHTEFSPQPQQSLPERRLLWEKNRAAAAQSTTETKTMTLTKFI